MNSEELIALVQDQKWSTLRGLNKAVLRKKMNKKVSDALKRCLLTYSPYTDEVEKTYRHLFGMRHHLNNVPHMNVVWRFHEIYPNPSRLYYEIDHGMWQINQTECHTMMLYYDRFVYNDVEKWKEVVNQLILRGEDINIQDDYRNTILHQMIYEIAYVEHNIAERIAEEHDPDYDYMSVLEDRKNNIYQMIVYLLEHGADPFLIGSELTPIEMVEELLDDQTSVATLITMMTPYC